jgi:aspartate/glutamate racemase
LPLAIKQSDVDIPLWDTMGLHAAAAVEFLAGK